MSVDRVVWQQPTCRFSLGDMALLLLLLRGFFAKRVVNDKGEWFLHPPFLMAVRCPICVERVVVGGGGGGGVGGG